MTSVAPHPPVVFVLASFIVPLTLCAAAPSAPLRAQLPADVTPDAVSELAQYGEVALLPAPDTQPFNALLITRSSKSCRSVAGDMMDIESWPKRWNIKEATVLERTPHRVRYDVRFDMVFAPRIPGLIDHPDDRHVVFNDVETGAQFIWTLDPIPMPTVGAETSGCAMRYSLLEAPGKASGWVGLIKALESSAVDAGNFAAALSSARGFAQAPHPRVALPPASASTFARLAAHGTVLRTIRNASGTSTVVVRRWVNRSPSDVLWAVRDKKRYPERVKVIRDVEDRGRTAEYAMAAFGGRVNFSVAINERGSAASDAGMTVVERVTGGDIAAGSWTWHIRAVPGGTDVELAWNVDIAEGSAVMRTLARADPVAREALGLHMALALATKLIGGNPLGTIKPPPSGNAGVASREEPIEQAQDARRDTGLQNNSVLSEGTSIVE